MPKKENKRTFESETLILPALKMVLVDPEKNEAKGSAKKPKQKPAKDFNEDIVLRIINKLTAKD